jgi:uncharacterized protein YxjI
MTDERFGYDRYLVDQLVRPIANLYRVTPLAVGDTPAGGPVAFVRQKKLAIKEDIRFYADESEAQELFRIKARSFFDTGGSRYHVTAADGTEIGVLHHQFGKSLLRTTWRILDPDGTTEIATARERNPVTAILRRGVDFLGDVGMLIPIPYNFDILSGEQPIGKMDRKFQVRDRYVLDLAGDPDRKLDRRLAIAMAIGLDTLQNR